MAGTLFLKVPGCEGDATDKGHQKEIDLLDYRLSMRHPVNFKGSGMSGGETTVEDIVVTKLVDKASPNLMKFCLTGKHLDEVVLTARKRGEDPIDYIKITLKNCMISSVDHSNHGDDHREVVPWRAQGYVSGPAGEWLATPATNDAYGPGGLLTTVPDLLKWQRNLNDGRVGGPDTLARVKTSGRLNDEPLA